MKGISPSLHEVVTWKLGQACAFPWRARRTVENISEWAMAIFALSPFARSTLLLLQAHGIDLLYWARLHRFA